MADVIVCDSHSAIQIALEAKLAETENLELVGIASSVDELQELLQQRGADILVLELTLPGAVGVDLIRRLTSTHEAPRIVVYTMYDEAIYAARAIRAGASAYVMKRESTESVVAAIQAALHDKLFLSEEVAKHLGDVSGSARSEDLLHPTNALTDDEMTVFQLLGEGRAIDEISTRLDLPRRDIEEMQQRAVDKLGFETREALVQYASRIVHQ